MRKLFAALATFAALVILTVPTHTQTVSSNTTISGAVNATQTTVTLASVSNVSVSTTNPLGLWVDLELMTINAVNTTTAQVSVQRGQFSTIGASHASGATVIITPLRALLASDPVGTCTRASNTFLPLINTASGNVWSCDANLKWIGTNIRQLVYNSLQTR